MKKQLLTLLLLLTIFPMFSQSPLSVVTAPVDYDAIEVKPEFSGGNEAFTKYFVRSFQLPEEEGLSGEIKVKMVIGPDGKVGDVKVLRDLGDGTGKEAVRVLQASPKWKPGTIGGKAVAVVYEFAITIRTN